MILVLNCGSSSIKFQVLEPKTEKVSLKGVAENLQTPQASLHFSREDGVDLRERLPASDYASAIEVIARLLDKIGLNERLLAIGHRVVHGGRIFNQSVEVDHDVLDKIKGCNHLAPVHNPLNVIGIELMQRKFPHLPQVAVFDTAFHQTLPPHAYLYALPYEYYTRYGIRRFGFHGISHRFVTTEAAKKLGKRLEKTSLISAHLGNGCSICAVKGGKSIDTSMGFTPLEGLVMGQRSGDIDPSVVDFLADKLHVDTGAVIAILNERSGLLGLSGLSENMQILLSHQESPQVQVAIELFCYRLAKYIASYIIPLRSVDGMIFTGGIGEHATPIRERVLQYLEPLNLRMLVIPTNEELLIAQDAAMLVKGGG